MLPREENELITRWGRAARWATRCGATGSRHCSRARSPSPRVRRCGCGSWAKTSSPFATVRGGSALGRILPASPRLALLRPQRGMRAALRLSRLEVRRRRKLRRPDERTGREPVSPQSPHHRLSDKSSWAGSCGLSGAARAHAGGAQIRLDPGAQTHRHVTKVIQECNWLQALEGGPTPRTRRSCTGC